MGRVDGSALSIMTDHDRENSMFSNIEKRVSHTCETLFLQGYQDSNLENAGVRVQCLTVWR